MKSLIFIFVPVFVLWPNITASAGFVEIFSDDFESYTVGAAPTSPWIQRYNQNSVIVSPGLGGAGQSVMLRGAWNWSDTLSVDLVLEDTFEFQVACMVGNGAAAVGLLQFSGAMVSDRNSIWFGPDWNVISWSDGTVIVPYCLEDTWYQASVTISGYFGASPTADVIVYDEYGNQLGAQYGLSAMNFGETPQQQLVLHTRSQPINGQGAIAYFDNVNVGQNVVPVPGAFMLSVFGLCIAGVKLRKYV